jgi:hypothetical protein
MDFEGPLFGNPGVFSNVFELWWRSGVVLKSIGLLSRLVLDDACDE